MNEEKLCVRCGGPRPPHALKYCEDCRKKIKSERDKAVRLKQYMREKEMHAQESVPAPHRPKKKKLTPEEQEAAERSRSTNGWIKKDIVQCVGCCYWRRLGSTCMACHYPIEVGKLRPMRPKDCYKHEGTPYAPKRKEG